MLATTHQPIEPAPYFGQAKINVEATLLKIQSVVQVLNRYNWQESMANIRNAILAEPPMERASYLSDLIQGLKMRGGFSGLFHSVSSGQILDKLDLVLGTGESPRLDEARLPARP